MPTIPPTLNTPLPIMKFIIVFALLWAVLAAQAAEIVTPTSVLSDATDLKPILCVIRSDGTLNLSIQDLEHLPLHQTTLQTTFGISGMFQGILMRDLIAKYQLNKHATHLVFHALDNYTSALSLDEFERGQAFLATRLNGQPISLNNKGPLILLWPEKEQAALAGKSTPSSWVWSIKQISVE